MRKYWHDALLGKSKKRKGKTPAEIGFDYCISCLNWKRSMRIGMPPFGKQRVLRQSLSYGRLIGHSLKQRILWEVYAVGRKNFLSHDTVKGTWDSSIIYSLVDNCKTQQPEHLRISGDGTALCAGLQNEPESIEKLMPWSDMIQQRCRIKSKS